MKLRPLSDDLLLSRLRALVGQERENVGDIVEHLSEIDRREFIVERGFSSLFDYCIKELRYSEGAAYTRIRAARAIQDYPRVLDDLRSGAVHLESIARLYPYLTTENSSDLLNRAAGAPKRQILALVANFESERPERDVVRPLPSKSAANADLKPDSSAQSAVPSVLPAPSRIRFAFTADDELVLIVDRLRGLLRHKHPAGRLEDIFKDAAKTLLDRIDREKSFSVRTAAKPRLRSRRIPKAIKVAVWNRDGGRCAYVADDGRRCESQDALEYDHVIPWASGGRSDTAENVRLLCRPHNQRLARRRFGPRRRTVV